MGLGVGGLPHGMGRVAQRSPVGLVARDMPSAELWLPALLTDAVSAGSVFLLAHDPEWIDRLLS